VRQRLGLAHAELIHQDINSGQQAEQVAEAYLVNQGLVTIQRNYTTSMGEIDLIMQDGDCLVFVEVKYRQETVWADALESVTKGKQQRIIKAAKQYLQSHRRQQAKACRFDVLGIDGGAGGNQFNWIQHAFE